MINSKFWNKFLSWASINIYTISQNLTIITKNRECNFKGDKELSCEKDWRKNTCMINYYNTSIKNTSKSLINSSQNS